MEAMTEGDTPTVDDVMRLITFSPWSPRTQIEMGAEKVLRSIDDPEYLQAIREVALRVQDKDQYSARNSLSLSISKNERRAVFALLAHKEWHLAHLEYTGSLLYFATSFLDGGYAVINSDGTLVNLEELMLAVSTSVFPNRNKLSLPQYVKMAYEHIDHLNELVQYRDDRGLDREDDVDFVPLDEAHFAESLKHGSLSVGWL